MVEKLLCCEKCRDDGDVVDVAVVRTYEVCDSFLGFKVRSYDPGMRRRNVAECRRVSD
jgi:hypothetical protein